jgi:hypothetical protein
VGWQDWIFFGLTWGIAPHILAFLFIRWSRKRRASDRGRRGRVPKALRPSRERPPQIGEVELRPERHGDAAAQGLPPRGVIELPKSRLSVRNGMLVKAWSSSTPITHHLVAAVFLAAPTCGG